MPDIFDEVEEDLRADRLRRMLFRYGGLFVAALVVVVLAVGGWQIWVWYQSKRAVEVADIFLAATKVAGGPTAGAAAAARPQLDAVAARGAAGYRSLARLHEAAGMATAGDLAGASAAWDGVAQDGGTDPLLRDFANLQWALHNLDTGEPKAVAARLDKLAAPTGPWHGLAEEGQALLALRQGRVDAARDTLRLLAQDTGVPQGVRQRASGLLDQIGPTAPRPDAAKAQGS